MNKENFEIVTTFDGDGGGLTPLSVLATALVALPDFLAAFPEFLGGLRLFRCQRRHGDSRERVLPPAMCLGKFLCEVKTSSEHFNFIDNGVVKKMSIITKL